MKLKNPVTRIVERGFIWDGLRNVRNERHQVPHITSWKNATGVAISGQKVTVLALSA